MAKLRYFHVFIRYHFNGRLNGYRILNLKEDAFMREIVKPYNEKRKIWIQGLSISPTQIEGIALFESGFSFSTDMFLENGAKIVEAPNEDLILAFSKGKISGVTEVTPLFLNSIPKNGLIVTQNDNSHKKTIFIVHGRNETPAYALQKHLTRDLGLDADMFEDFKRTLGSKTVIEALEEIKNRIDFAFIIATPDDYGCLVEDYCNCEKGILLNGKVTAKDVKALESQLSTRARQNVGFEFGLFIGALGRERVCCLMQMGIKEPPSDLSGVLYEEFNKRVNEKFTDMDAKLRKIGLIK
ncbi:MAG: nucleotide-binding protein [Candidatus Bathyarchaeota archaeon]|nr:nucleotide-binding protein [Candidatus Bathyarchaeota archaeon]